MDCAGLDLVGGLRRAPSARLGCDSEGPQWPIVDGAVVIPPGTISIRHDAFFNCAVVDTVRFGATLVSIEIPDSVTSIGANAFHGCTSLATVEIPDSVTSIGISAFRDCSSLVTVAIPDSVTTIGQQTFYDCTRLTTVGIPSSVTSIGDHTFYACTSLATVALPDSVTSIGAGAFNGCTSLASVKFPTRPPPSATVPFSDADATRASFNRASPWSTVLRARGSRPWPPPH